MLSFCLKEYWWAVLLMGVAFVLFMGVFIKCCAVHTPSSNPKKPPALSITQTLRHPYSTLRRKRHHNPHQQPTPSAPYVAAPNPTSGPSQNSGEPRNPYNRPKGNSFVLMRMLLVKLVLIFCWILFLFFCSGGPASGWGHRAESSPYAYSGGQGGRASAYEMNVRQHRVWFDRVWLGL